MTTLNVLAQNFAIGFERQHGAASTTSLSEKGVRPSPMLQGDREDIGCLSAARCEVDHPSPCADLQLMAPDFIPQPSALRGSALSALPRLGSRGLCDESIPCRQRGIENGIHRKMLLAPRKPRCCVIKPHDGEQTQCRPVDASLERLARSALQHRELRSHTRAYAKRMLSQSSGWAWAR